MLRPGQIRQRHRNVDRRCALFSHDRFRGHVGAVHSTDRITLAGELLYVIVALRSDAIKPRGDLVWRDFDRIVGILELHHEARLSALLLKLVDVHVLERPSLELPARVSGRVDYVQLLALCLVELLLHREQVLNEPDRGQIGRASCRERV